MASSRDKDRFTLSIIAISLCFSSHLVLLVLCTVFSKLQLVPPVENCEEHADGDRESEYGHIPLLETLDPAQDVSGEVQSTSKTRETSSSPFSCASLGHEGVPGGLDALESLVSHLDRVMESFLFLEEVLERFSTLTTSLPIVLEELSTLELLRQSILRAEPRFSRRILT